MSLEKNITLGQTSQQAVDGNEEKIDGNGNGFFEGSIEDLVEEEERKEAEQLARSRCQPEHIDVLLDAGALIFPVRKNKTPAVPRGSNWKTHQFSQEDLVRHRGPLGIVPGSIGLSVIDIDATDYSDALVERIEQIGEKFCVQKTLSGGTHVAFKTAKPVRNAKWEREGVKGDFRGKDGYVVMWEPAVWAEAVEKLDTIPDANDGFKKFWDDFVLASTHNKNGRFQWDKDSIREVLDYLDASVDRQQWIGLCRAIADAGVEAGMDEVEIFALVKEWSQTAPNWKDEADLEGVLRPTDGYQGPHANGGPLMAAAKDGGWTPPNGHGGRRDRAGRRRLNPDVGDPLTVLADTCVSSRNFVQMYGLFAHWCTDRKKWELASKSSVLAAIAVRHYLQLARLEPAQSITQGVGPVLEALLILHLQGKEQKTPKFGIWAEKGGKVFDQHTGKRRDVEKEDYITEWLDYDIDETNTERPKLLEEVLLSAFDNDMELVEFFDDCGSYMLFEKNHWQKLFHWFGKDSSGKGVLSRLFSQLMGQQNCHTLSADALKEGRSDQLCDAPGKQLLVVNESMYAMPQDTAKQLTGGDRINARRLYKEPFTFIYEGHLLFVTQGPLPYQLDQGMLRRIVPIHFKSSPKRVDTELPKKLEKILPQIFGYYYNRWVSRVRKFKSFEVPQDVANNIDSYRQAEGTVEGWIIERLEKDYSREHSIAQRDIVTQYFIDTGEDDSSKNKDRVRKAIIKKLAGLGFVKAGDRKYWAIMLPKKEESTGTELDNVEPDFDDTALIAEGDCRGWFVRLVKK